MEYVVFGGLAASVCFNAFLGYKLLKKPKTYTADAKELLAEILSGPAIVKIQVLDASQLILRSPRL